MTDLIQEVRESLAIRKEMERRDLDTIWLQQLTDRLEAAEREREEVSALLTTMSRQQEQRIADAENQLESLQHTANKVAVMSNKFAQAIKALEFYADENNYKPLKLGSGSLARTTLESISQTPHHS